MMRRISLGLLAATAMGVIACHGASAADMRMPVKAVAPPPPPVQDWSGIYVGVEGGYGWGQQQGLTVPFSLNPSVGEFGNHAVCDVEGIGYGGRGDCDTKQPKDFPLKKGAIPEEFAEFDGVLAQTRGFGAVPLGNINTSGWLFGAFFGAQKQWGSWVLGLEADVDGAGISGSTSGSVSVDTGHLIDAGKSISLPDGNEFLSLKNAASLQTTIDELASVRGKIGYAWSPNWMFYGTGGMAFAHVKNSLTQSQSLHWEDGDFAGGDSESIIFNAASTFSASADQSMLGWTVGAGLDYKWQLDAGSALIFGVEYQYFNFPSQTFTFTGPSGGSLAFNTSETINVVKGRISYLFSIH
jgi:opacity protein-like surface antigen